MNSLNPHSIFYPVFALAWLSLIMGIFMLRERIHEMKTRRIHPQKVASSTQMSAVLENTRAADNYKNLFEMPVLFYVLCLALFATQKVSPLFLYGAWGYVALRYVHSYIHVGYNKVMHRFNVFALSWLLLATLWVAFVLQLAQVI